MKYTRLTKEQFEEMQEEFATFLATQQITAAEWQEIKAKTPEVAEQELDVFSDLVWEKVLQKVTFLDKIDAQNAFLFQVQETGIHLVVLKVSNSTIDLTTTEGMQWLTTNYKDAAVEIFQANKKFSADKLADIFQLIQQGSAISDGTYYNFFAKLL